MTADTQDTMTIKIDWETLAANAEAKLKAQGVNLGTVLSRLARINKSHEEAYAHDSHYDGGEFSGPALARSQSRDTRAVMEDYGLDRSGLELYALTAQRTTSKFAFFSGLFALDVD